MVVKMTVEEFLDNVELSCFKNNDGVGFWGFEDEESGEVFDFRKSLDEFNDVCVTNGYTHIWWYNN